MADDERRSRLWHTLGVEMTWASEQRPEDIIRTDNPDGSTEAIDRVSFCGVMIRKDGKVLFFRRVPVDDGNSPETALDVAPVDTLVEMVDAIRTANDAVRAKQSTH